MVFTTYSYHQFIQGSVSFLTNIQISTSNMAVLLENFYATSVQYSLQPFLSHCESDLLMR